MGLLLIFLVIVLAFANGANDLSKGIATLVGTGVSSFKRAVIWGTFWTVTGGLVASLAAQGLVQPFNSSGLQVTLPEGSAFLAAVAVGAIGWLIFASLTGLPVSTTHAIMGALIGARIGAAGFSGLRWNGGAMKAALPLALSPLLSLSLLWLLFPLIRRWIAPLNKYCVCVESHAPVVIRAGTGAEAYATKLGVPEIQAVVVGSEQSCATPSVSSRWFVMDGLHWLSSAATSFARGLNDAPKILALGIAAGAAAGLSGWMFYVLVAAAMGSGSLLAGFRVTETLARKVTPMDPTEGFAANLITSVLVGAASVMALPVSTTHVSSSAIIGVGLRNGGRNVQWKTVRDMLLAWVVTVPVAAMLAAGAYWVMR
jgi:PiT family inorganic phosphate transporter